MIVFCILWVPFVYLLFRSLLPGKSGNIGLLVLVFLINTLISFFKYLNGPVIQSDAFGFIRWLYYFVDILSLPVLVPLLLGLFIFMYLKRGSLYDVMEFTLVYLIPESFFRAIIWSEIPDPVLLVAVPVLWTALALGLPYLLMLFMEEIGFLSYGSLSMAILIVPLANTALWLLYEHAVLPGGLLLLLVLLPCLFLFIQEFRKSRQ